MSRGRGKPEPLPSASGSAEGALETDRRVRLDQVLRAARVFRRRTVGHDVCALGSAAVNGHPARPGKAVKAGDLIELRLGLEGERLVTIAVLSIPEGGKLRPSDLAVSEMRETDA